MLLDLELAENYFIVPAKDKDTPLMWVGNQHMMSHLVHLMVEDDIISIQGIGSPNPKTVAGTRCVVVVNWTQQEAETMLQEAGNLLRKTRKMLQEQEANSKKKQEELNEWLEKHPVNPNDPVYDLLDGWMEVPYGQEYI